MVACERKNLEAQGLYFALFRAGTVLGSLGSRATRRPEAPAVPGLDYAGLSGQAFDALPLYVTFDCTQSDVLYTGIHRTRSWRRAPLGC